MKTILRGISMRLSLIAMVLCLCAAWPGHGLAWGMAGSASLAGMTPGAPQGRRKGGTVYQYSGSCSLLLYLRVESGGYLELKFQYRELHERHGYTCTAGEHR